MPKIVIIGAGWAGVSAAVCAKKAGADVTLIEKTDLILGAGNAGGIFRNNGRYTALEEMKALGAGELFDAMDKCAEHINVEFPGHSHASLYNVNKIEPFVRKIVMDMGIQLMTESHVDDIECRDGKIFSVILHDATRINGDAFVDATGSSGPMGNCLKYGNGCSMCIQRCPTFGPRVSITAKAGIKDLVSKRADGTPGVFSGACKIHKSSLSKDILEQLNSTGVAILKVPSEDVNYDKLGQKACKQYALKEYSENIILLDTGSAKLMTSYYPLEKLRKIPGMEQAEYIDPYSAGRGNSIRYLSIAPCDNTMLAQGSKNIFCGGEKGAPLIGHTEAVVTGALAGHNAVRYARGLELVTLPDSLAVGLIISHSHEQFIDKKEYKDRFTFAGGVFFEMMKERHLYTTDVSEIQSRIEKAGLKNIYENLS
jgi:ribulose 1,5-bisphosphate synthetase/thiazole synthase